MRCYLLTCVFQHASAQLTQLADKQACAGPAWKYAIFQEHTPNQRTAGLELGAARQDHVHSAGLARALTLGASPRGHLDKKSVYLLSNAQHARAAQPRCVTDVTQAGAYLIFFAEGFSTLVEATK